MMKDLWKIIFSVLATLLGVALVGLISAGPRGYPVELAPLPSPAPLVVHVVGAVLHPGPYSLPAKSRINDAIQAAGGFSSAADQQALNLAAWIEDGSQVIVPVLQKTGSDLQSLPAHSPDPADQDHPADKDHPADQENPAAETTASPVLLETSPTEAQTTPTFARPSFPININTATSIELELLPEIGPVRAARIVAYRDAHGPFEKIEDLRKVYDINAEVFAAIRDLITVGLQPPTNGEGVGLTPSAAQPVIATDAAH